MRLRHLPALLLMTLLAVAAWAPGAVPQAFAQQDKLHHAAGFLVLAAILRLTFPARAAFATACVLLVAAAGLELGQLFLPTRTASLGDFVASVSGVLLGLGLAAWWSACRRTALSKPQAEHCSKDS